VSLSVAIVINERYQHQPHARFFQCGARYHTDAHNWPLLISSGSSSMQSVLTPLLKPLCNALPIFNPLLLSPRSSPKRSLFHALSSAITHTNYRGSSTIGAHSSFFFPVSHLTHTFLFKCPPRRTVLLSRHRNSNPTNITGR